MSSVLNDRKVSKRSDLALDLSPDQWALAEDLVKVLKPFEVATTVLSAEYNASLSCVLPVMKGLVKKVGPVTNDIDTLPSIVAVKETLSAELKEHFQLDDVKPN